MEPAPGRLLRVTERFALAHDLRRTWAGVEGFRLEGHDVEAAVEEVHAMVRSRAERCSWWLTERSTPADLEERLLALGLVREDDDYLHAGMLLTREPPRVDDIEVRQVTTLAEYTAARRLADDAFASPHQRVPTEDELAIQWEREIDPTYAAWIDGRLASVGRVIFTRVGAYLMGGATAEWARGRGAYRAVVRARRDAAVERGTPRPRGRRRLDVEADPRAARLRAGASVSAARAPSYGLMFWLTWNRLSGSYLRFTCASRS